MWQIIKGQNRSYILQAVLALFLLISVVTFFSTALVQGRLKRSYLWNATIVGSISWSEARLTRKTVVENEPQARCVRVGLRRTEKAYELYVFTQLNLYIMEKDVTGRWRLKSKGPYSD